MDIWSLDKIVLFAAFAVPGFISLKIYDINTSGYYRDTSKQLIDIVSYSCLNLALCSIPIFIVEVYLKPCLADFMYFCFYAFILFVIPVITALGLYRFRKSQLAQSFLPHPLHRSWDCVFFNSETLWMKVVLKNGKKLIGYYGEDSFTSTDPSHYQIYLQQVWRPNKNGGFKEQKHDSKGLIVSLSEISYVEFFSTRPESDEDEQTNE